MGFLYTLLGLGYEALDNKFDGKISAYLGKEADKRDRYVNTIMKMAENMKNKSDDELKRIYQTGNTDMKRAAGYLLKQRGY